ncbi:MAG: L-lactate permease, partial [Planctomycetes bacterium]|nr:L-lactate permease [Planctomycetota bacterium]
IVSMLAVVALLRFWQPRTIWRFEHEQQQNASSPEPSTGLPQPSQGDVVRAWLPWV